MTLTFTQCLWRGSSELGHRFLCELSDIKMGIKTLLAMKYTAICQLKELSECVGQAIVVALKAWKKVEEVNVDRGSDVSKVLEVENTCAKFKQFL